ncbi:MULTISPECIES: transglycosylase family protein [unclassified Streptomyces]|uniref:transglycosylase family protein n=1 Tax=unclassified Streptomyces TaxID=2593676 RepID=UPI0033255609
MLSGQGRHRRPRQAPAIVVAAGVTGSAIAIPLLGAGSASAADAATWDRVAACESGGQWSADMDNGYYGGLQFAQETWEDFGGTEYADRADLASRSQQIAVAEKVLEAQGPEAWATCAGIAGLTQDGTGTGVDPGASAPGEQNAPATSDNPLASLAPSTSASPSETAEPAPAPTQGIGNSGTGDSGSGESGSATGKHRGEPAAEPTAPKSTGAAGATGTAEPGNADNGRESGRHASRGDDVARGGEGAADEAGEPARANGADAAPGSYIVRPGDSLSAIAASQKLPGGWSSLYEANAETVGDDPDLILPGQSLELDPK